jgi:Uma2 family endonuclease
VLTAKSGLTLEEFLDLPEREPPLEFEDGEITQKVSPKAKHSRLEFQLILALAALAESAGVVTFPELRVTFGGRSVVPDLSVIRRDRVPVDAAGEVIDDVMIPPDVVFEVLSPRQSVTRTVRRCIWYVANGVPAAVLVDNKDRSIFVFRPGAEPQTIRGEDVLDLGFVVPGFAISADELFASLRV